MRINLNVSKLLIVTINSNGKPTTFTKLKFSTKTFFKIKNRLRFDRFEMLVSWFSTDWWGGRKIKVCVGCEEEEEEASYDWSDQS